MILLPRRSVLGLAAVVDIAVHAHPLPVAAKALAARLGLPPRHLEPLLQALVRAKILKGVRGPRGGYELAKERRGISASDILQAVLNEIGEEEDGTTASKFIETIVLPMIADASKVFLHELDHITIEEICRQAENQEDAGEPDKTSPRGPDFTI
jgi:Rrf2 family iron-sulfur cluster assembly transcriptional regulator